MGTTFVMLKQQMKSVYTFLLILPLVGTFVMGSLLDQQQREFGIPIAIVDMDQTDYSQRVLENMKNQSRVIVQEVSKKKASLLLSKNEVDSVFVMKEGFEQQILLEKREQIVELWVSPNTVASGFVQEVFASEVLQLTSGIKAANKVATLYEQSLTEQIVIDDKWAEALAYNNNQWKPQPLMTIDYVQGENIQQLNDKDDQTIYSPYIGLWSFFTMVVCFVLTDWFVKERGILFPRIQSSWKGLELYIIQRASATVILQLIQVCISYFILIRINDKDLFHLLAMSLYVFYSMGIVLVMASMVKQIGSYYATGIFVSFFVAILGGAFFPIEEMVPFLERYTIIIPTHILFTSHQLFERIMACLWTGISICFLWLLLKWRLRTR